MSKSFLSLFKRRAPDATDGQSATAATQKAIGPANNARSLNNCAERTASKEVLSHKVNGKFLALSKPWRTTVTFYHDDSLKKDAIFNLLVAAFSFASKDTSDSYVGNFLKLFTQFAENASMNMERSDDAGPYVFYPSLLQFSGKKRSLDDLTIGSKIAFDYTRPRDFNHGHREVAKLHLGELVKKEHDFIGVRTLSGVKNFKIDKVRLKPMVYSIESFDLPRIQDFHATEFEIIVEPRSGSIYGGHTVTLREI